MPPRPMDSILADEPSVHKLPFSAESDSPSETSAEGATTAEVEASEGDGQPEPKPVATKAAPKSSAETADDADDESDPDPVAVDGSIEKGLRTALSAVRGDKRKLKKQWRETEKKADEAARRIAHLEGQIAALSQRGAQKPEQPKGQPAKKERPDFYGDPEAHLSVREMELREELRAETFRRDAARSERTMRRQHQDYEEAKAAFYKASSEAPENVRQLMWARVVEDPDPAEIVYEEGKKLLGGIQANDEVSVLKARIAELEAAKTAPVASATTPKPARPTITPSNAGARGTGNGVKQAWTGPRKLESILA